MPAGILARKQTRLGPLPMQRDGKLGHSGYPVRTAAQAAAIVFLGSKNGLSTIVACAGPCGIRTTTSEPIVEQSTEIIARAMFRSRRGEYTADVTLPTTSPFLVTGQNVVFGPASGAPSMRKPTCLRVAPDSRIRRSASLPMK